MKFGVGILYKKLPRKLEFRENGLNDSYTLPKGINEFLSVFSRVLDRFESNSV